MVTRTMAKGLIPVAENDAFVGKRIEVLETSKVFVTTFGVCGCSYML